MSDRRPPDQEFAPEDIAADALYELCPDSAVSWLDVQVKPSGAGITLLREHKDLVAGLGGDRV